MDNEPYNHLTDPLRNKRITASMVGAILGHNPYMTREEAMRAMVRAACGAEPEFKGNIATEYGNANEAGALLEFEMETGIKVTPARFVVLEDWAGCTVDGWTSDGGGIENKCPYALRDKPAPVAFKALWMQPHYDDQVQFQLAVTGVPHIWFNQWTPVDTTYVKVEPDQEWQDKNLPILRQFYAQFLSELENPEEHLAPLRIVIDTPAAQKMTREWDEITEQLELLTERKKDLLTDMVALAKERNAEFAGRKLTKVEKAGAVSYAKVVKAKLPDLDLKPWTGKSSEYWRLS